MLDGGWVGAKARGMTRQTAPLLEAAAYERRARMSGAIYYVRPRGRFARENCGESAALRSDYRRMPA